jgi:hypothetical protein
VRGKGSEGESKGDGVFVQARNGADFLVDGKNHGHNIYITARRRSRRRVMPGTAYLLYRFQFSHGSVELAVLLLLVY